jgi:SPP1 family phage portal protein
MIKEVILERVKNTEDVKFDDVIEVLCVERTPRKDKDKFIKEYELDHEILKRPDKIIKRKVIENGKETKISVSEAVAKILLSYQKKIVEYAVAFLFGKPINLESKSVAEFESFKEVWKSLKMDNVLREVSRRTMIETEAAILFYPEIKTKPVLKNGKPVVVKGVPTMETTSRKLRSKILCVDNGDDIFAYFDEYGDLEAFTRKYQIYDMNAKKHYERYDIFMDNVIIYAVKKDKWIITSTENIIGKIPVIYFYQKRCEWNDVQGLIDREEMHRSKHADTNDYFGSPAVVCKGKIENPPDKNDNAKFFQLKGIKDPDSGKTEYGDISYLTYDKDTVSVKLEHEMNHEAIHSFTFTPNITLDTLKSLGNTSGVALEIMFYDPLLKAQNKQELFGSNIERIINLLKVMIGTFLDQDKAKSLEKMEVEYQFSNPLPSNITEMISDLTTATGGEAIMSIEDAVMKNPLVTDKQATIVNLKKEKEQLAEKENKIENSFN